MDLTGKKKKENKEGEKKIIGVPVVRNNNNT